MTLGPQRGTRAAGPAGPAGPARGEPGSRGVGSARTAGGARVAGIATGSPAPAAPSAATAGIAPAGEGARDPDFRHGYSRDRAQLLRRLSRIEGQVRGISRMIEREEYCVDILQQTAALRAAIDAVSIMVLEDHVQGCVRTAAERGEADRYVDEVLDVVRRTLGRPIRSSGRT